MAAAAWARYRETVDLPSPGKEELIATDRIGVSELKNFKLLYNTRKDS